MEQLIYSLIDNDKFDFPRGLNLYLSMDQRRESLFWRYAHVLHPEPGSEMDQYIVMHRLSLLTRQH